MVNVYKETKHKMCIHCNQSDINIRTAYIRYISFILKEPCTPEDYYFMTRFQAILVEDKSFEPNHFLY